MKIYNYISGYLSVCADSPFVERFINICMHRGMHVWDVKKCGTERITFKTTIKAYKKIRLPAKRTSSHVRIINRHGLPFFVRKYRKRKAMIFGIIAFLTILWYSSNHIMGITVFGNQRLTTEEIVQNLNECGISLGARTSAIEPDLIRNRMMTRLNDLAWIGINANGSRVYIEIIERVEKEQGIEKDGLPTNLVAAKDGEIEQLIVKEGQTIVKVGSGVREGDVLVSGIMDNNLTGFSYVTARGEIIAKTRYRLTRAYPLKYEEETITSEEKSRYTLSLLNFDIPLHIKKKPPYDTFLYEESKKEYRLPSDMLPSLFLRKEKYIKIILSEKNRTPKEALETGRKELSEELRKNLKNDVEIIEETSSHTLNERGEMEVTVELICRENIAESVIIEKPLPEIE